MYHNFEDLSLEFFCKWLRRLGRINLKSCLLWDNSVLPPIPFSRNVPLDFSISSGISLRGGPSSSKVKDRMKTHTQSSYYSSSPSLIIWDMCVFSTNCVMCTLALSSFCTLIFLWYCSNWFNNNMLIFLTFSCDWPGKRTIHNLYQIKWLADRGGMYTQKQNFAFVTSYNTLYR